MSRTVIVVDDVSFVRNALKEILTKGHFQVVGEAETGAQAVELYKRIRPDLVTMDVVMPEMSGIEATRRIFKADQEAKIVMISAMGQETLVMEAIHAGAKDYVLKPFKEKDVLRTMEHILIGAEELTRDTLSRLQR